MRKIALVFLLISSLFSLNVKEVLAAGTARIGTTEVYQERDGQNCNFLSGCVQAGTDVHVKLTDIAYADGKIVDGKAIKVYLDGTTLACKNGFTDMYNSFFDVKNGAVDIVIAGKNIEPNCSYKLTVILYPTLTTTDQKIYIASPQAALQCGNEENQCNTKTDAVANYDLCKQQIKEGTSQFEACQACFQNGGVWTAVGCIPSDPESVITTIVTIGLTAGGGIVLIMILVGSFMLSVSQGDPNKTKEAKEIITSAIIGLLFVIFSVTILQFIGVSILRIPGFGE